MVKRGGFREEFDGDKLSTSIALALEGSGLDPSMAERIVEKVVSAVNGRGEASSQELRDLVGMAMMEEGVRDPRWFEAAKRYELARIYNDVYGKGGWRSFDGRDLELSYSAIRVLEARYLRKDPETGRFLETPQMLFWRVARALASVESRYGASPEEVEETARRFYELMSTGRFMPNTPTLMNAGTRLGILSACFVIPVRDSMTTPEGEGIMDALRAQAIIHQAGGGTGFDFSELRPEGDTVSSSGGQASGPLSFMRLFDVATDVVKQGGKRRGANMGIMHVWHPDVRKFIRSKTGELKDVHLQNFNISVGFYDRFLEAVERSEKWPLINPRKTDVGGGKDSRHYAIVRARHSIEEEWIQEAILLELEEKGGAVPLEETIVITWEEALAVAENEGAIVEWVDARELWREIIEGAWDSGDPGFLNFDEINRRHPTWYLGKITATNPC
ncbi:MAG: ribonucleoside-diphosphate reductase, adenosylcobalamin-dependent, partial [Desulfurococcales archaeon]|nr:ribonucleoside-diphosphate reductase, adenosylcobalamin-dependent [Desulfurococcales archaeon]